MKLKVADYFILLFIIFISIGILVFSFLNRQKDYTDKKLEISVNGHIEQTIDLNDIKDKKIVIDNKFGHNVLEIKSGKVRMIESDCKDKICMKMGEISTAGDSIICLPNRLIARIISNKESEDKLDVVLK